MDCPRCALPLVETEYETVSVDVCEQCWGFWLDPGELEEVLLVGSLVFSEEERESVKGQAEIIIAKQRNGPIGDVPPPIPATEHLHYLCLWSENSVDGAVATDDDDFLLEHMACSSSCHGLK